MATLTGQTIATTYKTLMKGGTSNPVNLVSDNSAGERVVFGEDDGIDVRTDLYLTRNRVGIGTATPGQDLDVENNQNAATAISINNPSTGASADCRYSWYNSANNVNAIFYSTGHSLANKLVFTDSATSDVCFDISGKVGIGTTSPANLLDINAVADADCYIEFSENGTGKWFMGNDAAAVSGVDSFVISNGGEVGAELTILTGGNVGIGTAAPGTLLEVRGPVGAGFTGAGILTLSTAEVDHITDGDVLGLISFSAPVETNGSDAILPGAAIWAEAEADFTSSVNKTSLVFATAASETAHHSDVERMRITYDGKVGIGTATPGSLLTVGDITANVDTFIRIEADTGNQAGIYLYEEAAVKWRISNRADSANEFQILDHDHAQGVSLVQNDGDGFAVISDERWKTDWTEYTGALDGINTLRAGKYKFKNLVNGNIPDVWNSGLIAQDVEKILPDCVHTAMEENIEKKSLSYQALIPYLVKAVQELSAKVEALENA